MHGVTLNLSNLDTWFTLLTRIRLKLFCLDGALKVKASSEVSASYPCVAGMYTHLRNRPALGGPY